MGPTRIKVKQMVKVSTLVGGGFHETKMEGGGPLGWSENHHQVVVVAWCCCEQGTAHPCSPLWALVETKKKMAKIIELWDLIDELGDHLS